MENKLISITASPVDSSRVENEIVSQVSITETSSAVITSQIIESTKYNFNVDVSLSGYGEESIPSSTLFLRPDYNIHIVTPSEIVSKIYAKRFNHQFTKSDQVRFLLNKASTEIISSSDLNSILINKRLAETAGVSEALAILLQKPFTDSYIINDLSTRAYASTKLDVLGTTDIFSRLVDFNREFADSVTTTDDVLGLANIDDDQIAYFNKVLVDTTSVTQDVLIIQLISRSAFVDTITNSETKTANIQNFFQSDFVQAGYVGTNLTL